MENSGAAPLLEVVGLKKSYSVPVLLDFDFTLLAGEVHALVGSNGAGKSTFARILCGLTVPGAGEMRLNGSLFQPLSRVQAQRAGVAIVFQELNIISTLTIGENLFLNRLPRRNGFVRRSLLHQKARQALARVGLKDLDPATPAGELGVGQQQLVEIAGALDQECRVLILDEPTAALTEPEIQLLFENVRQMQSRGVGILFISHRMDEIRRLASRVTVMRDGRRVATHGASDTEPSQLVREMVGHDLPEPRQRAGQERGRLALRVQHLKSGSRVRDVSFSVARGEILGLAGLIGSGRTETLRAIFGADRKQGGEVFLGPNLQPRVIESPADAVRAGVGMVPEDRKREGLLMFQSLRVNTTLAVVTSFSRWGGWLDLARENAAAKDLGQRVKVRCASWEQPVSELSGGNQQKIVFARWLARDCTVMLFDEPTRGIDVAAKDSIYQLIRELAAAGKALVIVSSELTELMSLCDRIAVLSAGRMVAEFLPHEWSQEKITQAAFSEYLRSTA